MWIAAIILYGHDMKWYDSLIVTMAIVLFIAMLSINTHRCSTDNDSHRDTVRVTVVDTVRVYKSVPKDSVVIRYITQRLPVVDDKEDNFPNKGNNNEQNIPQSDNNVAENIPDSADVVIPITQKVYDDSTYTAYVSGYNPQLDSLIFRMPREVITIKECQKPKRWGVGLQVGYGMTVNGTPQFSPYIGIGVSYNLFSF